MSESSTSKSVEMNGNDVREIEVTAKQIVDRISSKNAGGGESSGNRSTRTSSGSKVSEI